MLHIGCHKKKSKNDCNKANERYINENVEQTDEDKIITNSNTFRSNIGSFTSPDILSTKGSKIIPAKNEKLKPILNCNTNLIKVQKVIKYSSRKMMRLTFQF